ncbi:MAG: glycoside hydrolase family 3 protein [Spirochaetota bacterium]
MRVAGAVIISLFVVIFPVRTGLQMIGDREEDFFMYKSQENTISPGHEYTSLMHIPDYKRFSLDDFYSDRTDLEEVVKIIMNRLADREKISQMVITACGGYGKTYEEVLYTIYQGDTGGVLFLDQRKEIIEQYIETFNVAIGMSSPLLPLYAVDGEPSLISYRIRGIPRFEDTNTLRNRDKTEKVAKEISEIIRELGIHMNFAPVCDFSYNREIIGKRSFGNDPQLVSVLTETFIKTTQENGVVATAKHFPGHGTVRGDTHWKIVYIKGNPPELPVFKRAIESGVIAVMVGHIAVSNNRGYETGGVPSSLSRNIVTGLLKNELGFRGIIVTDALTMGAVKSFYLPSVLAVKAGCDMILMPEDEHSFIEAVQEEIAHDDQFRAQVMESVRKIIRLKVCLGLVRYEELGKES